MHGEWSRTLPKEALIDTGSRKEGIGAFLIFFFILFCFYV